jgi:hypothetical protein
MRYRKLGKTDLSVSEIGIGCTHIPALDEVELTKIIDKSLDYGINFLDVCLSGLETRDKVGRAIAGRRDKFIIQGHIGLSLVNGQEAITQELDKAVQHLEDLFSRLKTGYIDIAMLHCIDSLADYENAVKNGLIDYMLSQKEKGIFKYLGFSSHMTDVATIMVNSGHFDVVMFSVNPLFDFVFSDMYKWFEMGENDAYPKGMCIDQSRADFYALCKDKEVSITAMKALAAGGLVTTAGSPFAKALTVPQCIHYALNRPAVDSVFIGFDKSSQIKDAIAYYHSTTEELDYSEVLRSVTGKIKKSCLYCNHCLPCPKQIDIGILTKIFDKSELNGYTEAIQTEYNNLNKKASECIECGECENRCPFGIDIVEYMRKAKELFE